MHCRHLPGSLTPMRAHREAHTPDCMGFQFLMPATQSGDETSHSRPRAPDVALCQTPFVVHPTLRFCCAGISLLLDLVYVWPAQGPGFYSPKVRARRVSSGRAPLGRSTVPAAQAIIADLEAGSGGVLRTADPGPLLAARRSGTLAARHGSLHTGGLAREMRPQGMMAFLWTTFAKSALVRIFRCRDSLGASRLCVLWGTRFRCCGGKRDDLCWRFWSCSIAAGSHEPMLGCDVQTRRWVPSSGVFRRQCSVHSTECERRDLCKCLRPRACFPLGIYSVPSKLALH